MTGESGTLPDQASLFWQQGWAFPANELVAHGLVAVFVDLVLIRHVPRSAAGPIVICHRFGRGGVFLLLGVEGVAVFVLFAADFAGSLLCVNLEDGVLRTVDVGIDPQAEEMLVVVSIDAGIDFCAPTFGIFTRVHSVGVQDPC